MSKWFSRLLDNVVGNLIAAMLITALWAVWAALKDIPAPIISVFAVGSFAVAFGVLTEARRRWSLRLRYVIHDGARWELPASGEDVAGPFCLDHDVMLGCQGPHGSRRKLVAEDDDYVGQLSALFCPVCGRTYQLGMTEMTAESTRFVGASRNEAAIRFLPAPETWPIAEIVNRPALTITVTNQKVNMQGVWIDSQLKRGTWSPTYGAVIVDVTFTALVPQRLSRVRLVFDGNEKQGIPPIGSSTLRVPTEIQTSETHRLIFHVPGGVCGGTKSARISAVAGDKWWRSEPWPVTFSKDITIG